MGRPSLLLPSWPFPKRGSYPRSNPVAKRATCTPGGPSSDSLACSPGFFGSLEVGAAAATGPRGEEVHRLDGERDPDCATGVAILRDLHRPSEILGVNRHGKAARLPKHLYPDRCNLLYLPTLNWGHYVAGDEA
jgi:hypothetical protein